MSTEQPLEGIEFSEQDLADLDTLGITTDDAPTYHPILHIWREVLEPAKKELSAKVTPQWANRIVTSYTGVTFGDMEDFREALFTKLVTFQDMVLEEIATDDECLNYTSPEEDVEHNSVHYKNLLRNWQVKMVQWEMEWDTMSPLAAVELASLGEVHKMIFGPTGITQFLDNIKFEYTEADQADLATAIEALRGTGE